MCFVLSIPDVFHFKSQPAFQARLVCLIAGSQPMKLLPVNRVRVLVLFVDGLSIVHLFVNSQYLTSLVATLTSGLTSLLPQKVAVRKAGESCNLVCRRSSHGGSISQFLIFSIISSKWHLTSMLPKWAAAARNFNCLCSKADLFVNSQSFPLLASCPVSSCLDSLLPKWAAGDKKGRSHNFSLPVF